MIKIILKNICLISFALIAPITLPAGGIQRNLSDFMLLNNSKEIILKSNCSLYSFPKNYAKKLRVLPSGSFISILRRWNSDESEMWLRVELATNQFFENPNQTTRGWIKI